MRLAVLRAAYGECAPPWELVEAGICEKFGVLPEQLDECDVGRLLRSMNAMNVYRAANKMKSGRALTGSEHVLLSDVMEVDRNA